MIPYQVPFITSAVRNFLSQIRLTHLTIGTISAMTLAAIVRTFSKTAPFSHIYRDIPGLRFIRGNFHADQTISKVGGRFAER